VYPSKKGEKQMPRIQNICLTIVTALIINGCVASRVIRQTETEAAIQGLGITKIEARMKAEEKAKDIFTNYALKKEPDCTQEYHAEADKDSAEGGTYWSCVIEVTKK